MMVALASSGVRLMPSMPSTMAPVTTKTKKRQTLATTPDMVVTRAARAEPERFAAWLATRSRRRRISRLPSRATMIAMTTTSRMPSGRTIRSVTVDAVSGLTPSLVSRWYSQPPPWST